MNSLPVGSVIKAIYAKTLYVLTPATS